MSAIRKRSGGLISGGMLPMVQTILLVLVTLHTWPAGGPGPSPAPIPSPGPGPAPAPVVDTEKAWVVMVEKTSEAAELRSDHVFWAGLEERKIRYRWYLENASDEQAQSIIQAAKAAGLPALVFVSADGKLLKTAPAPATGEEADQLTREVLGR